MKPEAKRELVTYWKEQHDLSERRACELIQLSRSTYRYESHPDSNEELRKELKRLAKKHMKYGCPKLYTVLRRNGWPVNHKRVERLYKEEQLALRQKQRTKRIGSLRVLRKAPEQVNEQWGIDFVHDTLGTGRRFRCFTVMDVASRVSPLIYPDYSIPSVKVIEVLEAVMKAQGIPQSISLDNGPEFRSREFESWAIGKGIELQFIEPGKPTQNAFIESFNGTFRNECLNSHWFTRLEQARYIIENWRHEYNEFRPHQSLKGNTPVEYDFLLKQNEQNLLPTGT